MVEPLDEDELERLAAAVREPGAESVAICLLFSYLDPATSGAIAERLRAELPGVHVSASHEVLAQFREYERCSTTVIDAYLSPLLGRYLGRLAEAAARARAARAGGDDVLGRRRAGRRGRARRAPGACSPGPAGGAVGAGLLARLSGDGNALGFDMGGTSCDVCVVEDGRVRRTDSREIGGRVIQLPMVDVHTVGAGGGSIGWRDAGGALRVGPRSAGAEPGPACYGRGGSEPTVTDANLLLGYLDADSTLAGGVELDAEAAERGGRRARRRARPRAARRPPRGSSGSPTRRWSGRCGWSRSSAGSTRARFALMPFGGAGPMHAAAIADELGIERILCPRASGVLSALGLLASERRRDTARTVMLRGERADRRADRAPRSRRCARRSATGSTDAEAEVAYELRYRGQAFELAGRRRAERPDPDELAERFAAEHERRYGYRDPDAEVELVNVRAGAGRARARAAARGGRRRASSSAASRRARFGGEWLEAEVLRGEPAAGDRGRGPVRLRAARGDPRPAARLGGRRSTTAGTIVARARPDERATRSTRSRSRSWSAPCAPPARRWARC